MGMNNVYYRFRHLIEKPVYAEKPARLRMNRLAKHEMHFGSFLTMNAMLDAIDQVRHEEVQALVDEVLDEEQLALTTYGPLNRRNLPRDLLGGSSVPLRRSSHA